MKRIIGLLVLLFFSFVIYAQTAEEWFQKGEDAYDKEEYNIAVEYYKKAAHLGSTKACGLLAYMYYYGDVDGKRNTEMASLWANRVNELKKNLDADVVLALISYYEGDLKKTEKILSDWQESVLYPEAKLALAISYMINKKDLFNSVGVLDERIDYYGGELFSEKAKPLIKSVYDFYRKNNLKCDNYYASCALLAYIEYGEKYDMESAKLQKYLLEFGNCGEDNFVYCPLNEYLCGRILSHFGDEDLRDMGKIRLEIASQCNYKNKYEILYPFADEIKKYYDRIKEK